MASSKPRLDVQLKHPAYRSGRDLTGTVILDSHGSLTHLTRLFVECLGYSEVTLEAGPSSQKRLRREHLCIKQDILPPNSAPLDSRRFDFKLRLPATLPHSTECDDIGFVRYCCRVVACPECAEQLEAVTHFSLIEEIDLNSELVQRVCRPSEQASSSIVQRIGSRTGKDEVKAVLVLTRSAYVPGENVECNLSVYCAACVKPTEQASIRLVQTITANGENGRQAPGPMCCKTIVQEQVQADEQYSEQFWSARCQFHIPGAVTSTIPREGYFYPLNVTYAVEMSISLAFAATPTKVVTVSCPVIVGTLPVLEPAQALSGGSLEASASFVDVCRCVISESDHHSLARDKPARTSSILGQLMGNRRKTSCRAAPPIQYTLYCIYYPLISQITKKKGPKSILKPKRLSVDNSLESVGAIGNGGPEQLQSNPRTSSISLHETQI